MMRFFCFSHWQKSELSTLVIYNKVVLDSAAPKKDLYILYIRNKDLLEKLVLENLKSNKLAYYNIVNSIKLVRGIIKESISSKFKDKLLNTNI